MAYGDTFVFMGLALVIAFGLGLLLKTGRRRVPPARTERRRAPYPPNPPHVGGGADSSPVLDPPLRESPPRQGGPGRWADIIRPIRLGIAFSSQWNIP